MATAADIESANFDSKNEEEMAAENLTIMDGDEQKSNVEGDNCQLDDSGDCPLLDTGRLPPPPERSPPPLLPNLDDEDEDVEENGGEESVDSLLAIKKKAADFVLEPPFLSAAFGGGASTSNNDDGGDKSTAVDAGGAHDGDTGPISEMGAVDLLAVDEEGETGSNCLTAVVPKRRRDSSSPGLVVVGQVFSAPTTSDNSVVIPDDESRSEEEKTATTKKKKDDEGGGDARIDIVVAGSSLPTTSTPSTAESVVGGHSSTIEGHNRSVNTLPMIMKPFDMRSTYSPVSSESYVTSAPPYYPTTIIPSTPPPTSSTISAISSSRVRNASANSGSPLLRHHHHLGGGGGFEASGGGGAGGSERDLPLHQQHSPYANVYEPMGGGAVAKDKTHRWSFAAGTAPEVSLLRLKLENVERELKELRGKHETTMNDYQAVLHQLELCRGAKCRQDVDLSNVMSELDRTKVDYDASCQQRMVLERQIAEWQFKVQNQQAEVEELRQQVARDLVNRQPGELATRLMEEEYKELRLERDNLREQCRYLDNSNADLRTVLLAEQNQSHLVRRERDEYQRGMEARLQQILQQLHKTAQERDFFQNENEMLKQQCEDACAERTRLIAWRQTMEQEFQQLHQKHDGVLTEYRRVMSERDSILKENERHSEEKAQLGKKLKSMENEYHSAVDQLKSVELQLHHAQQQQNHLQQQQQQQLKFENSREDLMSFHSSSSHSVQHTPTIAGGGGGGGRRMLPAIPPAVVNDHSHHQQQHQHGVHHHHHHQQHPFVEQRSIASSESEVALITSRAQEEELDEMRRQMESIKEQMELSRQQLDDATSRRDWALVERQRIVAERDSMRAMCDTLRRERDDAITRLATAIRDTDELQRQKQLAERECRKLREKIELDTKQRGGTSHGGGSQLNACSPSNSRDSAIDVDMAEWEIETLELSVDSAQKNNELGLELGGGRDEPTFNGTIPIYVKSLSKNSDFENILRPYDFIVQVNNIDVTNMERRSVLDILRNSTAVKMVIRRRRLVGMKLISVPLSSSSDGDMGVIFENGVYVSRIKTSTSASKAGNLAVGDRLVYVNDLPVHGKSAADVHDLLDSYKGCSVVLAVMKSPPVMSPTTSWPGGFSANSSNNHNNNNGCYANRTSAKTSNAGGIDNGMVAFASSSLMGAHRDESVQTLASSSEQLLADANLSSSGSCLALPKKQESLLDKMFRKGEKKTTVKAMANISVEPVMNAGSKSSVRFDRNNRYIRTNSVCSGSGSGSGGNVGGGGRMMVGNGNSDEQQVLQHLDRILEDSEKEPPIVNKSLATVVNSDKSSGGTWPKSRGIPPGTNVISGISTVSQQQSKKGSSRKPVFDVFQPPMVLPASPPSAPSAVQSSSKDAWSGYPSPLVSSNHPPLYAPVRPRQSNNSNTSRRRAHEMGRPLSYHPSVPVYPNSSTANASSSSGAVGFGSPLSSSGTVSMSYGGATRSIIDPLAGSSAYNHHHHQQQQPHKNNMIGQNFPSPLATHHHQHRPPSSQSNRKNKAISQYEPIYDDMSIVAAAFPRATPATVVKQHHPTHLAFVTPVRQATGSPRQPPPQLDFVGGATSSSSPWAPRSPTMYPSSSCGHSSYDQPDEVSSMTSLSSPTPGMYTSSGGGARMQYRKDYDSSSLQSPNQGEVRTIKIVKQYPDEGLGIRLLSGNVNGAFIMAVEKDSLALRHGLREGDQLLEICGINMRSANTDLASTVLRQSRGQTEIILVVQFNQNRYLRAASDCHHQQQSATSTPRATPNSMTGSYIKSSAPSRDCAQMQQSRETLGGDDTYGSAWSEPRFVFMKRESSGWPFTLIGGNVTGIFIDSVKDCLNDGSPGGLRCGDQILEFDGADFRKLTLEQALFELQQRPVGAEVSMLVQYNETKYQRGKRGAGDLVYVRVTVDRQAENLDELSFKAGDILRVDNTVFNGVPGLWRAWAVDREGREVQCGIIPSKQRLEDEFIFRRSGSEISGGDGSSEGGSRRGTIRRSLKFMRRSSRSTHQRAPSKDSRDLTEAADAVMADELYQRVERLDYKQKRPVLIVGALVDILVARMMEDHPKVFAHCAPECIQQTPLSTLNQALQQNIYIDYQKRDKLFEITRVAALKELMDKGFHCILRVSLNAIERLHRLQIYPVVVYVKFKDYKQIKELSESQVSGKEAKEMFQQSAALEADFHHLFTAVIQAQHCNIKYICQRIADAVEHEQKKTLWILSSENL